MNNRCLKASVLIDVVFERYTLVVGADLCSRRIEWRPIGIWFKGILVTMSWNVACTSFISIFKPSSAKTYKKKNGERIYVRSLVFKKKRKGSRERSYSTHSAFLSTMINSAPGKDLGMRILAKFRGGRFSVWIRLNKMRDPLKILTINSTQSGSYAEDFEGTILIDWPFTELEIKFRCI